MEAKVLDVEKGRNSKSEPSGREHADVRIIDKDLFNQTLEL